MMIRKTFGKNMLTGELERAYIISVDHRAHFFPLLTSLYHHHIRLPIDDDDAKVQ